MTSEFKSGPFVSDEYLMQYVTPLIERGFFPPLPVEIKANEVRDVLSSQRFANSHRFSNNQVRIPKEWDTETRFYLGHINEEGYVWKVDINDIIRDGTKSVFAAVAAKEKSQDEFYKAHPELRGERAYIAWLNSETPDF